MLVKFEDFEKKSSIVKLDNVKYLLWKHHKPNFTDLDVFSNYGFPEFVKNKPIEIDDKTDKLLNKYKNIKLPRIFKIFKSNINHNELSYIDEQDFWILYTIFFISKNKPWTYVCGATSEEISKELITISRRHIDERLIKLERLNFIKRESYTLKSLNRKEKGHVIYNKFIPREVDIKNFFTNNDLKWFPNDNLINLLTGLPKINVETIFSLQHLLRINFNRRFPIVYKREVKKRVILHFIKLNWLK